MGRLFKLRKNKKFNYTPRYYDDKGEGSPYRIEHKLDKFRKTIGSDVSLKGKFKTAFQELHGPSDPGVARRLLIITAILFLIFLYIIDFDLSIFTR